jgi:hypothetical protein
MKIEGACHCGAIFYEAEADPAKVAICHCTDCQKFSGAAWRASVPVRAEDFHLEGKPSTYIKTSDSGTRRLQAFCGTCGSHIYATSADDPRIYNLRLGTIEQRALMAPQSQSWCDSALPWAEDITGLPARPGQ